MARNIPVVSGNGGEIGPEVLLRTNLETYGNSAEIMENLLPKAAGPMVFRPGLKFCADVTNAGQTRGIDFVYDTTTYGILLSDLALRIEQGGGIIVRPSVSAALTDGAFSALLTGWTDVSTGSGSATGGASGLTLSSNGTDTAGVRQVATVVAGTTHALRIVVARGEVTLKLGSTAGGDEYTRTELRAGVHSIGVMPVGTILSIEITSTSIIQKIVTSIAFEAAGDLVLPTPWSASQLKSLRHDQSNNVIYFTSGAGKGKRLERRSASSWSLVDTIEEDGPFLDPNVDEAYTLTPSVKSGNGILAASRAFFKTTHVGAIFQLTHSGQFVNRTFSGVSQSSEYVKVQGVGTSRQFTYTISGTFTATVTLQRSIGNTTGWTNVQSFTTTAGATAYNDGTPFDNQTVYYRFLCTAYTSGSPVIEIAYTGGSTSGVVRVTGYTSPTVMDMEVIDQLGATTATAEWSEGAWSDEQGWPKAVALYDGRLWKGGYFDRFWGSKSDAYESHATGDAADDAIARNLAIGSARRIMAFMPLARLVMLTAQNSADVPPVKVDGGAAVIKSSAFDEPLTPTNLTVRSSMASRGVYVDRDGVRAMEMYYSVESQDYAHRSLMRMHENLGRPGIEQIAVSDRPDVRLWFVRSDGQLLVKVYDPGENVQGWARIITDGMIESVYVKPADNEDEVMLIVRRTVGGQTKRYLEQFDPIYLTSAAAANRLDSYVRKTDAAGFTVITGLGHLEGRTVKVWTDGAAHPDCVVTGGQIALDYTSYAAVAGLNYTWRYKSVKPPLGAQAGTAIGQQGRGVTIQLVLQDSTRAIEYGQDFTTMDWLTDRDLDTGYDEGNALWTGITEPITMPGDLSRDPRVCLRGSSPHPVQINGYVVCAELHERTT